MMFFIEGQQINTTISGNKGFAAPYYPVADFRLNLGIVWYIFHKFEEWQIVVLILISGTYLAFLKC